VNDISESISFGDPISDPINQPHIYIIFISRSEIMIKKKEGTSNIFFRIWNGARRSFAYRLRSPRCLPTTSKPEQPTAATKKPVQAEVPPLPREAFLSLGLPSGCYEAQFAVTEPRSALEGPATTTQEATEATRKLALALLSQQEPRGEVLGPDG
jgi:hypothetical protein